MFKAQGRFDEVRKETSEMLSADSDQTLEFADKFKEMGVSNESIRMLMDEEDQAPDEDNSGAKRDIVVAEIMVFERTQRQAKEQAKETPVELWNGVRLKEEIKKHM